MPSSPNEPDPLTYLLAEAETELSRRLQEACEAEERGIQTESTQEIRRLEDALLAAAMAAEHTITVRRHIQRRDQADRKNAAEAELSLPSGTDRSASDMPPDESPACDRPGNAATTLREFIDKAGRSWRAWPVMPGLERRAGSDRRFLGEFQDGWICFEALDSTSRKRLPRPEPDWADLEPPELERLLELAIDAPGRRPRKPGTKALS